MTLYLISYDVCTLNLAGQRRLRRVAKVCQNYGNRVQNSVFECVMDYSTYLEVRNKLTQIIDVSSDNLRIYPMGKHGREKVVHIGIDKTLDVEGALIV